MGEEDRNGSNLYLDNIDIWALVYHTKKKLIIVTFFEDLFKKLKNERNNRRKTFLE